MTEYNLSVYQQNFDKSITSPDEFWLEQAEALHWVSKPTQALDASNKPVYSWFPNGILNLSYNALDRHVEAGRGDNTAIIYESAMANKTLKYSYRQLRDEVAKFASVLSSRGVGMGDRVVIYLPMIPEAHIAALACARIGAVHSIVFGGFAAKELATRIRDARPKVIVTADGGIEPNRVIEYLPIVGEALALCNHEIDAVIVKERPEITGVAKDGKDWVLSNVVDTDWLDWDEEMAKAMPKDPVPVVSTHPLYILYTSGTTDMPKGVVRDTGGYGTALAWTMKYLYNIGAGDVMFTASDVGWVVGHSYIIYGPLIVGATTLLYEGKPVGTPDAGQFWRLIEKHKVRTFFTAPTAIRAVRKEDPEAEFIKKFDISSLQALFLAGERTDPDTYEWAKANINNIVIDHWWQTETGWAISGGFIGLNAIWSKPGSGGLRAPGYDVEIVDDEGNILPREEEGNIVIRLPLPPGTLSTLWQHHKRYIRCYLSPFPGYYLTGDSGKIDKDGFVYVMGRTDDVINVAGHRLSTGQMEGCIAHHPAVAECAVVGAADRLKGQIPFAYAVLKYGISQGQDELRKEIVKKVRDDIGAVAALKDVVFVDALPKTRSGKVLRKNLRQLIDGEKLIVPPTIEDLAVLNHVEQAVHFYKRDVLGK